MRNLRTEFVSCRSPVGRCRQSGTVPHDPQYRTRGLRPLDSLQSLDPPAAARDAIAGGRGRWAALRAITPCPRPLALASRSARSHLNSGAAKTKDVTAARGDELGAARGTHSARVAEPGPAADNAVRCTSQPGRTV